MFGSSSAESLLTQCFIQKYGTRAGEELTSFLGDLEQVELSFDFSKQLRVFRFPPFIYPDSTGATRTFPGLPDKFYYYIPGTTFGSDQKPPINALDPGHHRIVDGIGMNFGCPFRLQRALRVLLRLPEKAQREARGHLRNPGTHLSRVEELFAVSIWTQPDAIYRFEGDGMPDWRLVWGDFTMHLEVKYRARLWTRVTGTEKQEEDLVGPASRQLTAGAAHGSCNVLALIVPCQVDDSIRQIAARELQIHTIIDGLIFIGLAGEVVAFSRDGDLARKIAGLVQKVSADEFGGFSPVVFLRTEQQRRQEVSSATEVKALGVTPTVAEARAEVFPPVGGVRPLPPYPYRFGGTHLSSGEPIFKHIPPFLTDRNAAERPSSKIAPKKAS